MSSGMNGSAAKCTPMNNFSIFKATFSIPFLKKKKDSELHLLTLTCNLQSPISE